MARSYRLLPLIASLCILTAVSLIGYADPLGLMTPLSFVDTVMPILSMFTPYASVFGLSPMLVAFFVFTILSLLLMFAHATHGREVRAYRDSFAGNRLATFCAK